jgi:hypothetical protein
LTIFIVVGDSGAPLVEFQGFLGSDREALD